VQRFLGASLMFLAAHILVIGATLAVAALH
jgi:hypothetical protein